MHKSLLFFYEPSHHLHVIGSSKSFFVLLNLVKLIHIREQSDCYYLYLLKIHLGRNKGMPMTWKDRKSLLSGLFLAWFLHVKICIYIFSYWCTFYSKSTIESHQRIIKKIMAKIEAKFAVFWQRRTLCDREWCVVAWVGERLCSCIFKINIYS